MTDRVYLECQLGDTVLLVLDHRVVEIFSSDHAVVAGTPRWHVDHIGVDAKPRKDGLRLKIGARRPDDSLSYVGAQAVLDVPQIDVARVLAFFEHAKTARG